jgi:hypothetical protein
MDEGIHDAMAETGTKGQQMKREEWQLESKNNDNNKLIYNI